MVDFNGVSERYRGADPRLPKTKKKPHIVLVVPRGEAVRNFLYSDTLRALSKKARVTLLSVVDDQKFRNRFAPYAEQILTLKQYPQNSLVSHIRTLAENAHDRWLWSAVAQNNWDVRDRRAVESGKRLQRQLIKISASLFANQHVLRVLTSLEQYLSWKLRATDEFEQIFKTIKPDLVFNCSHVHAFAGELPLKVASRMGIPTAGFIFSWDNLTSRSRIFVPYDYYLVWNENMRNQLLSIYPKLDPESVHVTGTPQFDFHFNPTFWLSRKELCDRIGLDFLRPFVLYTTGISNHFYEEHRHVESVIHMLNEVDIRPKPQLVVRTYAKGTSAEMKALATRGFPDVVFPPVLWDEQLMMPKYEDLIIYTNLLRHARLGINAASTVSLELMMLDKPVINLDFDPPGVSLPSCLGYSRHIRFDHYRPVVESGGVMVAKSEQDMRSMLYRGLSQPSVDRHGREAFTRSMFGDLLGTSGERVAEQLVSLTNPQ